MHIFLRHLLGRVGLKNIAILAKLYQCFVSIYFRNKFNSVLRFRDANFVVGKDLSLFPSINSKDFESKELDIALNLNFPPGSVLWDVGANIGIWSVLLARRFPATRIISFEPQTAVHELLTMNIAANCVSNIEIQKIALGASCEVVELRTPKQKYGSSSIVLLKKIESDSVELIEIVTADAILTSRPELAPSFIKIDIEGYEPRMISGAHKLITDNLPIIMMEVSPKLWGTVLTSDWEDTLNFLMKVYGSTLICDGNAVSEFSTLNFTKIGSRNRNFFFGLPS